MKILIDSSPVRANKRIGFYRYSSILLNALHAADHENSYEVITQDPKLMDRISQFGGRFHVQRPPGRLPMLHREGVGLLGSIFLWGIDVVHFPCTDIWFSPRGKKAVVTVHDLALLHYPEYFFKNSKEEKIAHFLLKKIAELSAAIVTISDYSRKDMIERLKVPPEKIFTIYNSVDTFFLQPQPREPSDKFKKLALESPYFLFVGDLDFRKNIPLLLRAFSIYRQRGGRYLLALVGHMSTEDSLYYPSIEPVLKEMKDRGSVRHFQGIGDDVLPEIYQRSGGLVFPSSFEGFGSPLLEAMAMGAPIITVQTSCLPEVAGDAALIVPLGEESLAEAMQRMEQDESLRTELIQKGRKRLENLFMPVIHGRHMKALYEKLANRG